MAKGVAIFGSKEGSDMMDTSGLGDTRLRIHIDVSQPVELRAFAVAFIGLQQEFEKVLVKTQSEPDAEATSLYISKIENGSIVAEIAWTTPD